ncbi:HNH endonuclease [Flavobacterium sp. NRK F10]|uniref:HNH endonuclease n=1 Tax=Flavobacterium sp. NRK F10 TaxID=2954931 RepID=UPI002090AB58|nr:HNH endonuclease [Flavobacterium sp. NRK F10]MCO6175482.1 HNH endonuclease [Flavobacterium sp. NRK F10]
MNKNEIEIIYEAFPEKFYEVYKTVNSMIDYVSPKEEFHICRYCNSQNATFKSKAHLLPEFTGNKTIFTHNECDDCNHKFGLYETNLSAFSGIKNSFLPIKGKKKYPKFKSNDSKFSIQFQDNNKVIAKIEETNDSLKIKNGSIEINTETQTFIPLYVFKSLVKFAISFMPKEDLKKFKTTLEWLSNPNKKVDTNQFPLLLIHNESRPPITKPIAILSKRKSKTYNSPEFVFIFGFGFHRLQIFLPFNTSDNDIIKNGKIILPLNYHFVTQKEKNKKEWSFGHFDMNSLNKVRLNDNFKLNFK